MIVRLFHQTVGLALLAVLCACHATEAPPVAGAAPTSAPAPASGLRLIGTVEAVRSRAIAVPRLAGALTPMIITRLARGGTRVEPGDIIIEFDRQEQQRVASDRQAEVIDLQGQIDKRRAELNAS